MEYFILMRQFILALILFCTIPVYGSAILWTEDNGLTDNEITAITKDRSGLMWIGTANGLSTFDGYNFISQETFLGKHINSLTYDKHLNQLWVCSEEGLWLVSCNDRSAVNYTEACRYKNVCSVLLMGSKKYIVFTNCTILELDANNSVRLVFYNPTAKHPQTVSPRNVISNGHNTIYIHALGTTGIYNINTETYTATLTYNRLFRPLMTFVFRKNGTVYISSREKLMPYKGLFDQRFIDSCNSIRGMHEFLEPFPGGKRYFLSTRFSSSMFLMDAVTFQREPVTEKLAELLTGKARTCLFTDDQNMVWIGTKRGLIRYVHPTQEKRFETIRLPGLKNVSTRAILQKDKSVIYIASYIGLIEYNREKKTSVLLTSQPCRELFKSGNRLYIGSESASPLTVMDIASGKIVMSPEVMVDHNPVKEVFCIAEDANEQLLLGTGNGLIKYNRATNTFSKDNHEALKDNSIVSIWAFPDKKEFWLGTSQGLYLYSSGKGVIQSFTKHTTPALNSNEITYVSQDSLGRVFICTRSGGVNVLSADMKSISYITKAEGLSQNEVYGIIPGIGNTYWISTYNGLCRYNANTKRSLNFYKEDGLPENEFNQNSILRVSEQELYFGGINGVVRVNPSLESANTAAFSLFASSINKWDPKDKQFKQLPPEETNIRLRADENLLNITLGGTDYRFPERNRFYYKVDELSGNWVMLPPYQPALRMEGLLPGTYHISIRAFDASGQASENLLNYTLAIEQYFYKTIWFYLVLMVVLALGVYAYFSWKIRKVRTIHNLRTAIASNLHDEIGSLLTQITMWSDSLRLRPKDFEDKTKVLENISSLSRQVNSNISDVLWAIDSRNDLGGSFTERLKDHAAGLLESYDIDFFVDSDETATGAHKISPDERQQLFLIYKEALNNILKHSKADRIDISFQTKRSIELTITNNGVADYSMEKVTGQGLKNMEMRAKKIGALFSWENSNGKFKVSIYKK